MTTQGTNDQGRSFASLTTKGSKMTACPNPPYPLFQSGKRPWIPAPGLMPAGAGSAPKVRGQAGMTTLLNAERGIRNAEGTTAEGMRSWGAEEKRRKGERAKLRS